MCVLTFSCLCLSLFISFSGSSTHLGNDTRVLVDAGYKAILRFDYTEGTESWIFPFLVSHAKHQACALRCCVRMSQGVFILRGRLLQRIVSFVMQFSILCCSGLRMRGERRDRVRDRAGISYEILWMRVDP